jgi:hypothetical protein
MKAVVRFMCTAMVDIENVDNHNDLVREVHNMNKNGWPELLRNETIDLLHVVDVETTFGETTICVDA